MSTNSKRHFRCAECGLKTSTTDPARAAVRVCVRCRPKIKPAAQAKGKKATPTTGCAPITGRPNAEAGKTTSAVLPVKASAEKADAKVSEAKPVGSGKTTALDAAATVLRETGGAMTPREIYEAIAKRGLWISKKGKTPEWTIAAAMGREIAHDAKASRFAKAGRGKFTANPAAA